MVFVLSAQDRQNMVLHNIMQSETGVFGHFGQFGQNAQKQQFLVTSV
jgi:hypothetical protein